jgi:hypothetical protein
VIGGMLTATFLAIFLIPMFYVKVRTMFARQGGGIDEATRTVEEHEQ